MSLALPPPIIPLPRSAEVSPLPPSSLPSAVVVPPIPVVFPPPPVVVPVVPPSSPQPPPPICVPEAVVSVVSNDITDRPHSEELEMLDLMVENHQGAIENPGHHSSPPLEESTSKPSAFRTFPVPYPSLTALLHPGHVQMGGQEYRRVHSLPPPREEELSSSFGSSITIAEEPKYIVFGGARYARNYFIGSSNRYDDSTCKKNDHFPSCSAKVEKKWSSSAVGLSETSFARGRKHSSKSERRMRLQDERGYEIDKRSESNNRQQEFLSDQLNIGYTYLNMQPKLSQSVLTRSELLGEGNNIPSALPRGVNSSSTAPRGGTVLDACTEVSNKLNWWTLAILGSPAQLLERLQHAQGQNNDLIDSIGYIHLNRRLWGLKKSSNTYSLGFGKKATALQFAAIMGRFDNVLLLVLHHAKDTPPLLKDLVSESTYSLICSSYYNSKIPSGVEAEA